MASSTKSKTPKKHTFVSEAVHTAVKLPSVVSLARQSAMLLWENRRLFGGITLVYSLLYTLLVQSLQNVNNVAVLRDEAANKVTGSVSAYGQLLGSSSSSQAAGSYQIFLFLLFSLGIIWALRQVQAQAKVRIRDAYYKGMYPLVPFILVLLVIGLQLLPLIVGVSVYQVVLVNDIAVTIIEKVLWGIAATVLGIGSLYLVASSIFALYIVTLADMTPIRALRAARTLVRGRRWLVLRKIILLPLVVLLVIGIILLPFILIVPVLAQWVLLVLGAVAIAFSHTYLYNLYRGLLNE